MMRSKKGQGLGFIAIIVMLALLYFIFRYNTQAFDFVITTGDQQAHLVTSFVETEKAKVFAHDALRQSAYEAAWKTGAKSCSDFNAKVCNDTAFIGNVSASFDNYIATYAPSSPLLSTAFPDYKLESKSCSNDKIEIEAFGFNQGCLLKSTFAFPETPCEDQPDSTTCNPVKFTNKNPGACRWDIATTTCIETNPEPDCEAATTQAVCDATLDSFRNNACNWETSYSEDINVLSAPLIDYQFRIDSDAHFIETVSCNNYKAFAAMRGVAVKPVCSLRVEPENGSTATNFIFNVGYKDDAAPKEISLSITNSSKDEIATAALKDLTETDTSDTNYFDGKAYYYTKSFSIAANNTAKLDCTDLDGNSATSRKDFGVI